MLSAATAPLPEASKLAALTTVMAADSPAPRPTEPATRPVNPNDPQITTIKGKTNESPARPVVKREIDPVFIVQLQVLQPLFRRLNRIGLDCRS
jgi:hypothetical protein